MRKYIQISCTVVVEKDIGSFHAYCPGLKGLHVDGQTKKEALYNAIEAAKVYIGSMIRHGDRLPLGPHFSIELV
jgi:predicted RNase H-like HicB family nuclease